MVPLKETDRASMVKHYTDQLKWETKKQNKLEAALRYVVAEANERFEMMNESHFDTYDQNRIAQAGLENCLEVADGVLLEVYGK